MQAGKKKMWQRPGWGWTPGKGFHRVEAKPKPKPPPKKLTKAETIAINLKAYQDKMNAAKPTTPPAPRISSEVAALNSHLDLINSIPQIGAPEGVVAPPVAPTLEPTRAPELPVPEFPAAPPITTSLETGPTFLDPLLPEALPTPTTIKIFLTGKIASGKDHFAAAAGCKVLSFAGPLYQMASFYFGIPVSATEGKDLPGIRSFLQTCGQYGRGDVNEKYPLTPLRALFIAQVRLDGRAGVFGDDSKVDWASYGKNPNIWLDACLERAKEDTTSRLAVSNVRFNFEFKAMQAAGWSHFHLMCSPLTWTQRLAKQGLTPESPAVKDVSEQLAHRLDASVVKSCSDQKTGALLRCIWSDSVPKPSPRLHSIDSALKSLGVL